MKRHTAEIVILVFILIYAHSSEYWLYFLGDYRMISNILYYLGIFAATMYLALNITRSVRSKFKIQQCNIVILSTILVLASIYFFPQGIIPKSLVYKEEKLVAHLDGVAGNNGWFILYGNNRYEYKYGRNHINGKYKLASDTVYFDSPDQSGNYDYDFVILDKNASQLDFQKSKISLFSMKILKNELIKK